MSIFKDENGNIKLYSPSNALDHITFDKNGNVEIPNGRLKIGDSGSNFARIVPTTNNLEVHTGSSAGDSFKVFDAVNNQSIAQFFEGGNVEIPSGDLTVGNVEIQNSTGNIENVNNIQGGGGGDFRLLAVSNTPIRLYDSPNSQSILNANIGGNVEIPNGDLSIRAGNVTSGAVRIPNGAAIKSRNGANTVDLSLITTSGSDVIVGDGNTNSITLNVNSDVDIPSGDLLFGGSSQIGFNNNNWGIDQSVTSSGDLTVKSFNKVQLYNTDAGQTILNAFQGGDVEIPNGNLSLGLNKITWNNHSFEIRGGGNEQLTVNTPSGGLFKVRNSSGNDIIAADDSGTVNISNGNLTLDSGTIEFNGQTGQINNVAYQTFHDWSGDSNNWRIEEDGADKAFRFRYGGTAQAKIQNTGDVQIAGTLTENASL